MEGAKEQGGAEEEGYDDCKASPSSTRRRPKRSLSAIKSNNNNNKVAPGDVRTSPYERRKEGRKEIAVTITAERRGI